MNDRIRLKNADLIDDGLNPGEIALDQDEGTLVFDKGDGSDLIEVPLDVTALPEPSESASAEAFVVFRPDLAAERALYAGGGGVAPDSSPWRAPGCIPVGFTTALSSLRLESVIEIAFPTTITRLRAAPAAGSDIQVTIGVETMGGDVLASVEDNAYAGVFEKTVDVRLEPGRYVLFLASEAPLVCDVLTTLRPFTGATQNHPVLVGYV